MDDRDCSSRAVALAVAVGARRRPRADSQQGKSVLKIGWAQDPQTLNPFVGQDEEDFSIWAINWDLLVNFSPKDLTPGPGHRRRAGTSPTTRRRSPST